MPRRTTTNGGDIPPPLPTTAHPQLSRSSSQQQRNVNNNLTNPVNNSNELNSKTDNVKQLAAKFSIKEETKKLVKEPGNTKYLNRSFSDAAYGRNQIINGNITEMYAILSKYRPKMSIQNEQEAINDEQMHFNNNEEYIEVNHLNSVGNSGIKRTGSCNSSGTEQLFSPVSNDTSPVSNRSLPTMGISMLGKKRLSNVSADCSAIEKAIANHNCAQLSSPTQGQTSFEQ